MIITPWQQPRRVGCYKINEKYLLEIIILHPRGPSINYVRQFWLPPTYCQTLTFGELSSALLRWHRIFYYFRNAIWIQSKFFFEFVFNSLMLTTPLPHEPRWQTLRFGESHSLPPAKPLAVNVVYGWPPFIIFEIGQK